MHYDSIEIQKFSHKRMNCTKAFSCSIPAFRKRFNVVQELHRFNRIVQQKIALEVVQSL